MFDPTAFDNMKTVVEGAFYDLDLDGTIHIAGRRDLIDLASYTRTYEIKASAGNDSVITATFRLESTVDQLAAELLNHPCGTPGAAASIIFEWPGTSEMASRIKELWGPSHHYEKVELFSDKDGKSNRLVIRFNRTVTEEMMDDLTEMAKFTAETVLDLS